MELSRCDADLFRLQELVQRLARPLELFTQGAPASEARKRWLKTRYSPVTSAASIACLGATGCLGH